MRMRSLFWSLLVVKSAASVVKLDKWAILVKSEHLAADMLRAEWKPPEHFGEYQQISAIFEPMVNALEVTTDMGQADARDLLETIKRRPQTSKIQ